jgi:multiple sugar transport system substrate-binding protein
MEGWPGSNSTLQAAPGPLQGGVRGKQPNNIREDWYDQAQQAFGTQWTFGLAAAGTLARPFIANAAAKTAIVWWTQGFIPEEDASFRSMVAEYEKASGNNIEVSIIPFAPIRQKIISALTSGDVPEVMANYNAGVTIVPQNAWNDKLIDMTDVVDTQKSQYHPTALLASQYYNNVKKKRSYYYAPSPRSCCRSTFGTRWW